MHLESLAQYVLGRQLLEARALICYLLLLEIHVTKKPRRPLMGKKNKHIQDIMLIFSLPRCLGPDFQIALGKREPVS